MYVICVPSKDINSILHRFSYSEWWRYIGSMKPRQPQPIVGRCHPERVSRTIRGFDDLYDLFESACLADFFIALFERKEDFHGKIIIYF